MGLKSVFSITSWLIVMGLVDVLFGRLKCGVEKFHWGQQKEQPSCSEQGAHSVVAIV
jgi:hypothetical protein